MPLTKAQEQRLVKTLFESQDGKKLLEHWLDVYVMNNRFHVELPIMYARMGQQEFVTAIAEMVISNE